ncbi:MAG: proton-coupled thiamine transporter YuaJ [Clostridiales bacterium]|nr:proton-coupled thiamine transporter YuaJ [Clostridiales bacterium]
MNTKTKALVESAIMIALAVVLDMVKVWNMPYGGSVTLLSMLPIMLVSIRHGIGWGLGSAFCFACIQIITGGVFGWGLTPVMLIGSLLLDYIVAFTVIGLAGLFRKKGTSGIMAGIILVCVLRFLSHFAAGFILWANLEQFIAFGQEWVNRPVLYSLCYNGMYMLPETVFTAVAAVLLMNIPQTRKLMLSKA